jgi:hypothetical protein
MSHVFSFQCKTDQPVHKWELRCRCLTCCRVEKTGMQCLKHEWLKTGDITKGILFSNFYCHFTHFTHAYTALMPSEIECICNLKFN